MNLTAYELSLIAGGFGIVGAILGAFIGYYFSTRLINRQEFNKAASDFRNAFIPEIIFLKHNANVAGGNASEDVGQSLSFGHYHRHLQAFEVFSKGVKSTLDP